MTKKIAALACILVAVATFGLAEEEPLLFVMPIPDGWRTETIPLPLEFAPDLPYAGLEELRFAPGMFEEGSDDFWTYAFVWWVASNSPSDAESLSTHLESYFHGLAVTVAESREISVGEARFQTSIEVAEDRLAIFFALSPQDIGHPVWSGLDSILAGFRCTAILAGA